MQKTLVVLGTVVLVTSTLCLATGGSGIPQNQNFDVATSNYVRRDCGVGLSAGINAAFVGLNQGGNVGRRGYVGQNTTALLGQGGVAWGRGGMSKVFQTGEAEGHQTNRVGISRRGGAVSVLVRSRFGCHACPRRKHAHADSQLAQQSSEIVLEVSFDFFVQLFVAVGVLVEFVDILLELLVELFLEVVVEIIIEVVVVDTFVTLAGRLVLGGCVGPDRRCGPIR